MDETEIDTRPHYLTQLFRKTYQQMYLQLNKYHSLVRNQSSGELIFEGCTPIINSSPFLYTNTGMFEDLGKRKAFQKLKEECYIPLLELLEKFGIEFMTTLFYHCNLKDLKLHGGTKIPDHLLKALDHFKTFEMYTND